MFEPKMSQSKSLVPKSDRDFLTAPPAPKPSEARQQRLMVGALVLLLAALALLLYKDRNFWFPETQEAEDQTEQTAPATTALPAQPAGTNAVPATAKKRQSSRPQAKESAPAARSTPSSPPANAATQRTVLPPLEVEVVAGDSHRTVRPGTNSVRVDLQPGSPPQAVSVASDTAASVTSNAAERVQMSADTANVVSHSVRPGYPLLARQMKVQGSVILQALIGRDGTIQDLHVLSGPPILASAAEEAVKQWRFKPHYLGSEAVETQARITVNFTISTN
jgi:periplasmic protein TonB